MNAVTTLEEAQELARQVVAGKPRSHVEAATLLARFVLGLQSVRSRLPPDPLDSSLEKRAP